MGDARFDVSDDTISVVIPIPAHAADEWPDVDERIAPHVTVVYVGECDDDTYDSVVAAVEEAITAFLDQTVSFGNIGYEPTGGDDRTVFSEVAVSDGLRDARSALVKAMGDRGVSATVDNAWVPRATIARMDRGEAYTGPMPHGSWAADALMVWRGDRQTVVDAYGRMDTIAHRGGKWLVLSEDGSETLGEFDTQEQARERLAEIEMIMAARDDGIDISPLERTDARSDEEKGEIRERWQSGKGPNMGPARFREWLNNPFAGPNRKSGAARRRAQRVAKRALRLIEKPLGDWTEADYDGAVQVLAFISRMTEVEQGDPLVVDGREGPSARDASLRDWGFDPKADRGDATVDEATVKQWLVEHVSDARKMPRDRMAKLKSVEDVYPYLAPPAVNTVYRGLRNIKRSQAGSLVGMSDAVKDKSWTTNLEVAAKFATTDWTLEEPDDDRVGVVLVADAEPGKLLLNHELLADLEGVADQWHDKWDETLKQAIEDEREVLALEPLHVRTVKIVPMASFEADGETRLVKDRADRKAPAVHVVPRTCEEVMRVDRAELRPPTRHTDGWLRYPILYSKAGNVQDYVEAGRLVREYRPFGEVMSRRSMDSGVGVPWELRHSKDLLNPRTVVGRASGCVLTVDRHTDGVHTAGEAMAWAGDLIEAIESGEARDVSVAYRCKIDRRPGTTDAGEKFDQRQIDIVWNSLASEPKGRAETARVLNDRLDRADVVTRADAMLQIARAQVPPSRPVRFDRSEWVPYDSRRKDSNVNLIKAMLAKHNMTMNALAEALGMSEIDLAAMLEGEMSPEQADKVTAAIMAGTKDGMMPKRKDALAVTLDRTAKIIDREWDSGPAKQRIWDWSTSGEDFDAGKAARAFLIADTTTGLKEDFHMPVADIVGGELVINAAALGAARSRLGQGFPEGVPADIRNQANELAGQLLEQFKETQDMEHDTDKPGEGAGGMAEMMKIMIGEMEYEVPEAVAKHIASLEEAKAMAEERADRKDSELTEARKLAEERKDALSDMVPRADAEKMAMDAALDGASVIELAKRAYGPDWTVEARKDGDGQEHPVTMRDWEYAAIRGAYGDDKGNAIIARLDAKPEAIRGELIAERLIDARAVLDERRPAGGLSHKSKEVIASITRLRQDGADRQDQADDDPLAKAKAEQKSSGKNYVGANPKTGAA